MKKGHLTGFARAALAVALFAKWLKRWPRRPVKPLYPHFAPADFSGELFEVATDDGLTLRGKRYRSDGAVPVILMAGFSGNGFDYDLAFEECNFALYLARRGYDVWVANFRATGREPYKSDTGDFSHSIEDVAIYDVPALVRGVAAATGKKPVIVGHSMGGVVSYGFLQGVGYAEEEGGRRVVPDQALSAERNEAVAAVVSVAGPVCFRWPKDSRFHWLLETPLSRLVLRGVAAALRRVNEVTPRVRVESMVVGMLTRVPWLGYSLLKAGLLFFANLENVSREAFLELLLSGSSDVSFLEAYQLADSMLKKDFTEMTALPGGFKGEPHNFTRAIGMVTAPILFITGDLDAVNHKTTFRYGYEGVSSEVKDFKCFVGYGHLDLLMGLEARETVFTYVADWLDDVV